MGTVEFICLLEWEWCLKYMYRVTSHKQSVISWLFFIPNSRIHRFQRYKQPWAVSSFLPVCFIALPVDINSPFAMKSVCEPGWESDIQISKFGSFIIRNLALISVFDSRRMWWWWWAPWKGILYNWPIQVFYPREGSSDLTSVPKRQRHLSWPAGSRVRLLCHWSPSLSQKRRHSWKFTWSSNPPTMLGFCQVDIRSRCIQAPG